MHPALREYTTLDANAPSPCGQFICRYEIMASHRGCILFEPLMHWFLFLEGKSLIIASRGFGQTAQTLQSVMLVHQDTD